MRTLPDDAGGVGGVLPFAEALARRPGGGVVLYHRVSSRGQAGPGRALLTEKTWPVVAEVRRAAPGRLRAIHRGVEEGFLSVPRPALLLAVAAARRLRAEVLVAADLSRLIRAAAYHRQHNPEAVPTTAEFAYLRQITAGLTLATLADPELTEAERHSLATRRGGRAGRPRVIGPDLAGAIFHELGCFYLAPCGRRRWERPLQEVARAFGVTVAAIHRAADTPSPAGVTWREAAARKAIGLGRVAVRDGSGGRECAGLLG